MKLSLRLVSAAALLSLTTGLRADVLELKNGTILNGKYVGGTAGTVRFEAAGGVQVLETSQLTALTFTSGSVTPSASSPQAATPGNAAPATAPPATQPASITLPAGTTLLVRMMDSVSSQNAPGAPFTTKLEYNLVVDGAVVAPAGTLIYG